MSSNYKIGPQAPVPTSADFIDIVLSKTQRKTPTQIHNGMKISRIRSFYMRKVKFTQSSFEEKLDAILTQFPVMENLHPFLSSLLNVLYDKNHYKLALGQLNTAKHLISSVGKDYCRLLKFGDSLFRCKTLKKAALGRMATIMKRQKDPLLYLEEVRQHMSRLPTIDPTTRTLLICGYPNVGKSSFVNKVTRADVDVQPYAFTTKSLFVGHMDYKYLRWQVIDTPGVLDHPLEEMNTIEMQSITALAHLRSAVLYFMDLSEQCGYTLEAQCALYESIKPLFSTKPTFLIINKIDVVRLEELEPHKKALLDNILARDTTVQLLTLSCVSEENIMNVRSTVCDALLAQRIEGKEKTRRVDAVAQRIRVAQPTVRDEKKREPFIPAGVATRKPYDPEDPDRRILERDLEAENGGAGVHSADLKKKYLLKNPEWAYDVIPEFANGKNVSDFIDPDIAKRLDELEEEEEQLQAAGFYGDSSDEGEEEDGPDAEERAAIRSTAKAIRDRKALLRMKNDIKSDAAQNRPVIPRSKKSLGVTELVKGLKGAGLDVASARVNDRAKLIAKAKGLLGKRGADDMEEDDEDAWDDENEDSMEVDSQAGPSRKRVKTTGVDAHGKRIPRNDRIADGIRSDVGRDKAQRLKELYQRGPNRLAKAGEADRHISVKKIRWMNEGKRKSGKTNHR